MRLEANAFSSLFLTFHQTPLQQWGEEAEDGAIYSIILERVKAEPAEHPETSECPFVQYRTCKRRTLRAATLPQLVKWLLTANKEGDLNYTSSFLATYQAFATLKQVLELLLPLGPDKVSPMAWGQCGSGADCIFSDCRAVLLVLEQWLQHHPQDFWEPPEYPNLHKILCFLHQSAPNSSVCALAKGLLQAHKEKEAYGKNNLRPKLPNVTYLLRVSSLDLSILTSAAETDDCEETPALMSFSVDEVAEQLTLMDAHLFRAVLPFHCLGCIWSQRDKKENQHMAPSVRATVTQFNAVTSCVITSVLGDLAMRISQRAHLLEKWIQIAGQCRALRNFSSLYAILSALQSNSIYRLKRTWAAVNRSSFRKLSQIFSEDHNHLNCREILLQVGEISPEKKENFAFLITPTIPYLGTFLTDLIMLDTALPDFVEVSIFERGLKEGEEECGEHLVKGQMIVPITLDWLQNLSSLFSSSYYISCMIEPPADSCPNSPKLHRSLTKLDEFSPQITSQDKTTAVVQRALQKHKLEEDSPCNYQLLQLLGDELLIPDSANVFYAMNPAEPHDFFLFNKPVLHPLSLLPSCSPDISVTVRMYACFIQQYCKDQSLPPPLQNISMNS
uniref:Ral guanine nucleotide dissociation stimulator like 3 n=1 Tax=Naja naja TaxID=35670 RepID=A0A8C6XWK0_NAJNA